MPGQHGSAAVSELLLVGVRGFAVKAHGSSQNKINNVVKKMLASTRILIADSYQQFPIPGRHSITAVTKVASWARVWMLVGAALRWGIGIAGCGSAMGDLKLQREAFSFSDIKKYPSWHGGMQNITLSVFLLFHFLLLPSDSKSLFNNIFQNIARGQSP